MPSRYRPEYIIKYCIKYAAIGAPVETARELDDVVMHESTVIVDSYHGAQTESGDIIISKVC